MQVSLDDDEKGSEGTLFYPIRSQSFQGRRDGLGKSGLVPLLPSSLCPVTSAEGLCSL